MNKLPGEVRLSQKALELIAQLQSLIYIAESREPLADARAKEPDPYFDLAREYISKLPKELPDEQ